MRSMARCGWAPPPAFATAAGKPPSTAPEDEIMEPDWWRDAEPGRLSALVERRRMSPLAHQMRAASARRRAGTLGGRGAAKQLAEADEALRRAANYARPDGPQSAEDGSAADLCNP